MEAPKLPDLQKPQAPAPSASSKTIAMEAPKLPDLQKPQAPAPAPVAALTQQRTTSASMKTVAMEAPVQPTLPKAAEPSPLEPPPLGLPPLDPIDTGWDLPPPTNFEPGSDDSSSVELFSPTRPRPTVTPPPVPAAASKQVAADPPSQVAVDPFADATAEWEDVITTTSIDPLGPKK
jgi:hypothetical protein